MQYSIQRLSQCAEAERSAIAGPGRDVMIGNADTCDLRLHVSFGLPDICLRIRVEDNLCVVENLTKDPGLVFVNGQGVYGVAQLDDGDAIQIGSDQFAAIKVREQDQPIPVQPAPEPTQVEAPPIPAIRRILETRVINSAVTRHHPCDPKWSEAEVLEYICDQHAAFLFVNFRHAGMQVPAEHVVVEDLFQRMPAEVRAIYSLHAITKPDTQQKLKIYAGVKGRDAAIWCIPETDSDACLADAKLYLAWFARPSVLSMALQESPKEFCEPLLKSFRLLLMSNGDPAHPWHLYAKPETALRLSEDGELTASV